MTALEGEVLAPPRNQTRGADFVFSPSPFRAARVLHLPEGGSIEDAVSLAGVGPRLRNHLAVYIADHKIERKHWKRIRPKPGAAFYMRVELAGGDGGKDVLRVVLMIAVVVVATMLNPWAGAATAKGMVASTLFMTAAVTAGQMLVNALIPPPKAKQDPWRFDQQPGNPYGSLTGFRNQYAPYAPIPRVIGAKRMFPLLAGRPYTEIQGNDQWLRLLLLVGYGPVKVSDIRIGTSPLSAFPGAQVEILEGWDTDAAPKLYTRQIREQAFQLELTPNTWLERVTEPGTQEVSLDVTFPLLIAIDPDDGDEDRVTVNFDVEWSVDGSAWTQANWIDRRGEWGTAKTGVLTATARSRDVQVRSGRFAVSGSANGVYRVRIRRSSPATVSYVHSTGYWTMLRSVRQDNPVNMAGMCLIALRLKASKQLNGVPDVINCLASAYHPVYDAGAESWSWKLTRNPAWQYADVLNRRGSTTIIDRAKLNLDAIGQWAAACDAKAPNALEKRWTCDVVLEGGSIFSAAAMIAAAGRAAPHISLHDGKYSIVRDTVQTTPVAHITPRNSWGYRGAKAFPDIPHAFRVSFTNPDKNDALDEIVVYRDAYNKHGTDGKIAASKFDTLDLPTCRSASLAWREGRYHLAALELRPEEHAVYQDIESLAVSKGDLVRFSHDVIAVGLASARIAALILDEDDAVTAIVLDGEVEMVADRSYAARIRHSNGASSLHPLDLDVGVSAQLTLTTPIAAGSAPAVGDLVMFGESGVETAPMIVKAIERADNYTARIVMVDAADGIHGADTGPIPRFESFINRETPLDDAERPRRPVLHVRSDERALLRLSDGTLLDRVELRLLSAVSARVPAVAWEAEWRADKSNGDAWVAIGREAPDKAMFLTGVTAGKRIHVRARTLSARGVPSDWEHVFDHLVVGKSTAPEPPDGLGVTATIEGVRLTFLASPSIDLSHYEVRTGGSSWDDATVLDANCRGSPAQYVFALSGATVFRVKAVDVVGLYSSEVTALSPASNASPWVPLGRPPTVLDHLSDAGLFEDLALVVNRPMSALTGRTANHISYSGGETVESLQPSEAGATVGARAGTNLYRSDGSTVLSQAEVRTAEGTASGITGQGALATRSTVQAQHVDIGDTANLVPDPDYRNAALWTVDTGWTFGATDSEAVAALGVPRAIKSVAGNGTTAQAQTGISVAFSYAARYVVEPGKAYRVSARTFVKAGFTGYLRLVCSFARSDGSNAGSILRGAAGGDYRSVAAASDTVATIDAVLIAPADAHSVIFRHVVDWSTTQNNAGYGYFATPRMHRAAQLGTMVVREDGSTAVTDASAVTALGTASGIVAQGALATKSSVDLNSSEVTNKSLANLDSSASTKLSGIATGATVGARAGTNLYRSDGSTVLSQAEVRTAEGTASGITGQGALATLSQVQPQHLSVNVDPTNLFLDPYYAQGLSFAARSGTDVTFVSGDADCAALGVATGAKISGETPPASQWRGVWNNQRFSVEPGAKYRLQCSFRKKAGFTGFVYTSISWRDKDNAQISNPTISAGVSHHVTPLAADATEVLDGIGTAPAGAVYAVAIATVNWNSTFATTAAGYAVASGMRVQRAVTAATIGAGEIKFGGKIYREDGSTAVTDAAAITALGTASGITAQSPLATYTPPSYAGNAAAFAALGAGQLYTDTSDSNKIKTSHETSAGSAGGGVKYDEDQHVASSGATHVEILRVAFANVASGGRYRLTQMQMQDDGDSSISSGASFNGGWEVLEEANGGGADTTLTTGTFQVTDTGGGLDDVTGFDAGVGAILTPGGTGARDVFVRIWRTSGSNNISGFAASLLVEYIPPAS